MLRLPRLLTLGGAWLLCALVLGARPVDADVIASPTVRTWGVYKDANGNGQFDPGIDLILRDAQEQPVCITNMLQYLSAGTSYGYKQYDNEKGADLSAWPNSSDGNASELSSVGLSHQTWLWPEKNAIQFWLGWSRLDHDTANPDFADAARGYNLNVIMHQANKSWNEALGKVVHEITPVGATPINNVKLDFAVKGSSLTALPGESSDPYNLQPRVILADDFSTDPADFPYAPYSSREQPRPNPPSAGDPYPMIDASQELYGVPVTDVGWDYQFAGNWNYASNSTDGGVLGNLRPDSENPGNFIIRVTLAQLYDPLIGESDPDGIKKIMFYSFNPPATYTNPFQASIYNAANWTRFEFDLSVLNEGDTFFIVDCCNQIPEPLTLSLLALGGTIAGTVTWRRRRRRA